MAETDVEFLTQEQKKTRPKFEDVAGSFLSGEVLENALDFVAYLRENNMAPARASTNAWKAAYKNKGVCYVRIPYESNDPNSRTNTWNIGPPGDDCLTFPMTDRMKEILWSSVKQCNACNGRYIGKKRPCNFGTDRTIFGREFKRVCGYAIKNPSGEALDFAKLWVEARKLSI